MTDPLRASLLILLAAFASAATEFSKQSCVSSELYVVPFPSLFTDGSDGSLMHPYASLQQALDHVARAYDQMEDLTCMTRINLYPTHHFVGTIRLDHTHSRIRLTTMSAGQAALYTPQLAGESAHHRLSSASISGGIVITGWNDMGNNTYSAVVPSSIFVNQLFVDDRRVARTRDPTNPSDYLRFAAPLSDPALDHYGFQYVPGQFDYKSLADAMVVVYHSWTTSHHYIDRLIPANDTILFTNSAGFPIGDFEIQGNKRFHIENLCEVLVPNSFCFVNATKTVYLMTDGSYNPLDQQIITPVNEFVLILASADATNPIHDIIMDDLVIQHSAWNIGRQEVADFQAAAFLTYATVFVANATSILFTNVTISNTGSYGLWIREGTSNITLTDSIVTDTAASGIRLGQTIGPIPTPTMFINISSNEISYGGNVFPSGVGVLSQRASYVTIADNAIHHHRYSGISVGWLWGYAESFTSHVLIRGNYIYDVGQHILNDQGGIYTLGIQDGTVIEGNVIKNVFSYAVATWGIYLDEGSSRIIVQNNVVYNTGWAGMFQNYGANNTIVNNVFARASLLPALHPEDYTPDGDVHIGLNEPHMSWSFTGNIVYDTFNGSTHSVYYSPATTVAPFSNNVYYNPYGTRLLFGTEQTSFEEWQKTGQDAGSVVADPLFMGDVSQCDFFTIRSESPAAKLGFQNLTKPTRWTPGCDTDQAMHQK